MSKHNIKTIRELLTEAFTVDELQAFCSDRPALHDVAPDFGPTYNLNQTVVKVIDYCRTNLLFDQLLAEVEALKPRQYARFQDDLFITRSATTASAYSPPPLPDPDTLPRPGSLPPGSRLPFLRNALFTGREAALKGLAQSLLPGYSGARPATQAVQGMGGLGKTQLAVEFAYRYGRFFQGVHWVNAAEPDQIGAEIAACGAEMELSGWPGTLPEQVARTIEAWQGPAPRLVVLDYLEDVNAARFWLREQADTGARVLVTSRRARWPRDLGLRMLRLPMFQPDESLGFLRLYLPQGRATEAELRALAERLGHLPLALELAGRYVDETGLAVANYVEKVEEALAHSSMRGWGADLGNPTGHDLDMVGTFALSWEQVENEMARQLFVMAGYCAPNVAIPYVVLERAGGVEQDTCREALAVLAGLGLVEWERGEVGPKVHPLLTEYGRTVPGAEHQEALKALVWALARLGYEALKTGLPGRFTPLRPHVEAAGSAAGALEREAAGVAGLEAAGRLWNALGEHLEEMADYEGMRLAYEEARKAYEGVLAFDKAALGPDHPKVAIRVDNLGGVLRAQGDLAGAREAFEQALAIDQAAYGSDHPKVAIRVNNLGGVLRAQGDLDGAKAAYEQALAIGEAAHGPGHPELATHLNKLGSVLQEQEDLAGARAAFQRALAIDEAAHGPQHPSVATDVNNLGGVMLAEGDLIGAKAAYQRALSIDEAAHGPDHPAVARDVTHLGCILQAEEDLAGARAAYQRAMDIHESAFGPEHPTVARDLTNLGCVAQAEGDPAAARTAFQRALAILQACYPDDHPRIALVRAHLEGL